MLGTMCDVGEGRMITINIFRRINKKISCLSESFKDIEINEKIEHLKKSILDDDVFKIEIEKEDNHEIHN